MNSDFGHGDPFARSVEQSYHYNAATGAILNSIDPEFALAMTPMLMPGTPL